MKAEIWELKLYYNIFDILCDRSVSFKELYIPELNYSINFVQDSINIIKNNKSRYQSIYSRNWCKRIKPVLITTIELDNDQIQLYRKAIKRIERNKFFLV